ncbi:MAG: hypothetical protein NTU61_03965 [Candidatus Altiarchaeota archaeon]|nr:hypothetical protein [Candidatus Altiarchaeota archaeon]
MIKIIIPAVLAFLFGLMYGSKVRFTGSVIVALAAGVAAAVLLKSYPYYTVYYSSLPSSFSEVLLMALVGVLLGSKLKKNEKVDAAP